MTLGAFRGDLPCDIWVYLDVTGGLTCSAFLMRQGVSKSATGTKYPQGEPGTVLSEEQI